MEDKFGSELSINHANPNYPLNPSQQQHFINVSHTEPTLTNMISTHAQLSAMNKKSNSMEGFIRRYKKKY